MADQQPAGDWQPIETAPKERPILVYMPEAKDITGKVQAAIHAKTANGHTWFIGHHFGFDCATPTLWTEIPR